LRTTAPHGQPVDREPADREPADREPVDRGAVSPGAAGESGRRRRRRAVAGTLALLVLLLVLTAVLSYRWGFAASAPRSLPRASASPSATRPPTTAEVYNAVAPSVVSIEAAAATVVDTGTGVIVNADGTILTALHVVKGAGAISVTFADGTRSTATVTSADPATDIATLGPTTLPSVVVPAVVGGSGRLAVGDAVIAIGNPLGLTRTTTTGVVSGLDRAAHNPDGAGLSGLIQFDAAVNPGSSGGPLLDARGETVGIVVALANPTAAGTFIGIGFAVPIGAALAAGGGDRAPQQ
jgi:S1-C subfamily serine protease